MKKIISFLPYLLIAISIGITVSFAGSLTPPGSPSKTMKSLSDLYQLINTGSNTPANDFTTPGTVSPTMNTLGDIYDLMTTKITAIDTTKILTGTSIFGKAGSASGPGVAKTGQTTCYITNGTAQTPCLDGSNTDGGQDGYYQAGIDPSYADNGDGTISDAATGLMWKKCSEGKTGVTCATGANATKTWTQALAACEADTTGGYTDWRLPNIKELFSLFDFGRVDPLINPLFDSQSADYWSNTSWLDNQNRVLHVNLLEGYVTYKIKSGISYVRCVR